MATNIRTQIYNAVKSIVTNNNDIGISTVIYEGQERVMPCIEIGNITESLRERFSCFDLVELTFPVRVLVRDNFNFENGMWFDVDNLDASDGSSAYIEAVRNEILALGNSCYLVIAL